MKEMMYKGFKIVTDTYLIGRGHFWMVFEGDAEVGNTLWNDDKMWNDHEEATKSGQDNLDRWLSGEKNIYFNPSSRPL